MELQLSDMQAATGVLQAVITLELALALIDSLIRALACWLTTMVLACFLHHIKE
jgi:hypothetical protein